MSGVRRDLPASPDTRSAFLLPLYLPPPFYLYPPLDHWLILKAAVALRFHAMLRFRAFCQLTLNRLTAILRNGRELPLSQVPIQLVGSMGHFLIGFMFTFSPKYTSPNERVTTAYFCHISDVPHNLAPPLPVVFSPNDDTPRPPTFSFPPRVRLQYFPTSTHVVFAAML